MHFDKSDDPDHPRDILFEDIQAATDRIYETVIKTPCEERGVRNSLLMLPEAGKKRGVISAAIGNFGIALSYHCSLLDIPCTLVMPEGVAIYKSNKCLNFGAKVILIGDNYQEAKTQAMSIADERKLCYFDGYDHPYMIEGNGSLGIEILEQIPDVDAILVPVQGGSLFAGITVAVKHLKPDTEIYGIETNQTCSMWEKLRLGQQVTYGVTDATIADVTVNMIGPITAHNVKDVVDKMVVVQEEWIARAVAHIVEEEKFVVESGGAAAVAAIMAGKFSHLQSKKVVCIVTEGNIDPIILIRVIQRGMAAEGRLLKFKVTLPDRPGEIALLCAYLAKVGVVLRDCIPQRMWYKEDVFSLELHVLVECKGWDHANELVAVLRNNYNQCYFQQDQDHPLRMAG